MKSGSLSAWHRGALEKFLRCCVRYWRTGRVCTAACREAATIDIVDAEEEASNGFAVNRACRAKWPTLFLQLRQAISADWV